MEKQIKVFLDSNLLFSIAYTGKDSSRSYLIYEIQELEMLKVFVSNLVCEEALFNIRKKKPDAEQFLSRLIRRSTILEDISSDFKYAGMLKLPLNDRIILSTAVHHKIDFFLTGNHRDFKNFYHKRIFGTLIIKPADFLNKNY